MTDAAVRLTGIEKRYGATRALAGADLELVPGRVHAIVGENGAGKSTLLEIAAGVRVADAGRVLVLGAELSPATPREAVRRGVAMVHQHFMLVPTLTGLENLALGHEPRRFGLFVDLAPIERQVSSLAVSLGLEVPLDVPVAALSVGERQRLELLRALRTSPKVLILDEPTAVLAPAEARAVLALAKKLAGEGVAVALVTHHLDEVAEHADEVTVLRRGAVVAHHGPGDPAVHDGKRLAREALGEDPERVARVRAPASAVAPVRLRLSSLETDETDDTAVPLRGIDLEVRRGEVVGVAGVEGNGQLDLERAIAGLVRPRRGAITLDGADAGRDDPRARRARGVACIASDRHAHGIAGELPARDVVRLGALAEVSRRGLVRDDVLDAAFADAVRALDVRPDDPALRAAAFSGGNQQKLVVARELRARGSGPPSVVLAAQPTRGVDVRAAARVRRALLDAAEAGAAVLLISSDLDELRAICDRIVVLRGGRLVADLSPEERASVIGEAMLGGAA